MAVWCVLLECPVGVCDSVLFECPVGVSCWSVLLECPVGVSYLGVSCLGVSCLGVSCLSVLLECPVGVSCLKLGPGAISLANTWSHRQSWLLVHKRMFVLTTFAGCVGLLYSMLGGGTWFPAAVALDN